MNRDVFLMLPDKSKVTIPHDAVLTMAEIATLDSTWYGRLIKIENVEFTWKNDRDADLKTEFVSLRRSIEKTGNVNAHQLSPVFAPSTYDMSKKYNIGYPMSREEHYIFQRVNMPILPKRLFRKKEV